MPFRTLRPIILATFISFVLVLETIIVGCDIGHKPIIATRGKTVKTTVDAKRKNKDGSTAIGGTIAKGKELSATDQAKFQYGFGCRTEGSRAPGKGLDTRLLKDMVIKEKVIVTDHTRKAGSVGVRVALTRTIQDSSETNTSYALDLQRTVESNAAAGPDAATASTPKTENSAVKVAVHCEPNSSTDLKNPIVCKTVAAKEGEVETAVAVRPNFAEDSTLALPCKFTPIEDEQTQMWVENIVYTLPDHTAFKAYQVRTRTRVNYECADLDEKMAPVSGEGEFSENRVYSNEMPAIGTTPCGGGLLVVHSYFNLGSEPKDKDQGTLLWESLREVTSAKKVQSTPAAGNSEKN
jgi:hypothetical protein